ncbi:HNH endonuclease [Pantoea sp. B9002]|uniref:HNH endonuclease signature motif containing protein n=1 Tax=Pantoea sp. B9002 TaxID=2726979 RepID=UPI0015A13028|nr:HNH endonuclease signature motif containing protein [Pantoea sp. B9002]NWA63019.1 HNH endonuclease [Pantoea sp. B9002]
MRMVIIPDCTGIHAIREDGKVINTKTGRILKTNINSAGYERLTIKAGNKKVHSYRVHRLIAEQFIPNDDALKNTVNHIDGNKLNNSIENLEWCSLEDNIRHAFSSGLHPKTRKPGNYEELVKRNSQMIDMYMKSSSSKAEIGRRFGIKSSQAKRILFGVERFE